MRYFRLKLSWSKLFLFIEISIIRKISSYLLKYWVEFRCKKFGRCLWLEWLIWHKSMIPFTNLRPLDALQFLGFCWRKSQFSKKWKIPSFTKLGTVEKVCNFLLKIIVWVLSEMSRVTVHQIRMEKYLSEAEI